MKKMFTLFVFALLLVSFASLGFVVASHDRNDSTDNSGSGSDSDTSGDSDSSGSDSDSDDDNSGSDDDASIDSDDDDELRDRTRIRIRDDKREFEKRIDLPNGGTIKIERKIEFGDDGEIKIRIKRTFTDADGNVIREIEIIIEKDEDGISREIKFEGVPNLELGEGLEIDDTFEGNESDLGAITSDGRRHKIKIMPDRASEVAIQRLKSKNFTVELREITHKNIPRVVYHIESNKTGRFLGVFKLAMKVSTEIDPETGEVLEIGKPWWAFLVAGEDLPDDTLTQEDLEELTTKVEISGDVELSGEAVDTLNMLVESLDGVEEKTELELKVKKEDGELEIESEVKHGTLTEEQQNLFDTLLEQIIVLVENAEGDDVELEIEIEREPLEDIDDEDDGEDEEDDDDSEDDEEESEEEENETEETNETAQ